MLPVKTRSQALETREEAGSTLDLPAREKQLILTSLKQCGWNQSESARKLGISRNTLRYRMKKFGINRAR